MSGVWVGLLGAVGLGLWFLPLAKSLYGQAVWYRVGLLQNSRQNFDRPTPSNCAGSETAVEALSPVEPSAKRSARPLVRVRKCWLGWDLLLRGREGKKPRESKRTGRETSQPSPKEGKGREGKESERQAERRRQWRREEEKGNGQQQRQQTQPITNTTQIIIMPAQHLYEN